MSLRGLTISVVVSLALGGTYLFADLPDHEMDLASEAVEEDWQKTNFTEDPARVKRFVEQILGEIPSPKTDEKSESQKTSSARQVR